MICQLNSDILQYVLNFTDSVGKVAFSPENRKLIKLRSVKNGVRLYLLKELFKKISNIKKKFGTFRSFRKLKIIAIIKK